MTDNVLAYLQVKNDLIDYNTTFWLFVTDSVKSRLIYNLGNDQNVLSAHGW